MAVTRWLAVVAVWCGFLVGGTPAGAAGPCCDSGQDPCGWKLGMQAYSFNRFTFFEAIDKTKSLGMHYIEAYPGQKLSPEKPDVVLDHNASDEVLEAVKAKLKDANIKLINYGVVGLGTDEAADRKVFEFAKKMGIETIVSEPPPEAFDLLDRLVEEYGINIAIHNHPKPSHYWNPDKVLEVVKGRSKRIGACADTGHWLRSNINALEAVRKLEGRIISFHFKDLGQFGVRSAHDVPWGTGKADIKAILTEMKRQGFQGVFSVEYEHNWMNSVPEIAECATYFRTVAAELAKCDSGKKCARSDKCKKSETSEKCERHEECDKCKDGEKCERHEECDKCKDGEKCERHEECDKCKDGEKCERHEKCDKCKDGDKCERCKQCDKCKEGEKCTCCTEGKKCEESAECKHRNECEKCKDSEKCERHDECDKCKDGKKCERHEKCDKCKDGEKCERHDECDKCKDSEKCDKCKDGKKCEQCEKAEEG